jgi:hypothetical protein
VADFETAGWRLVRFGGLSHHDLDAAILEWPEPGAPPPDAAPRESGDPCNHGAGTELRMIIGFCGLAGSGKTTAADALIKRGFVRLPFAQPLKRMFAALAGPPPGADVRAWAETPHDLLCGRTPRQALQTLGTEWGRDCVGADLWVRLWAADAVNHPHIVADDVRFPNEAEAIRRAAGLVIRIDRKGAGSASGAGHVCETMPFESDVVVANDGTPEALASAVLIAAEL